MTPELSAALKELRQAAEALTPQDVDSAELTTNGVIEWSRMPDTYGALK